MNIKKKLFLASSSIAIGLSAFAADVSSGVNNVTSDLKVKISGYADFQAGMRSQTKLKAEEKNVSSHRKDFAFYNSAAMVANVSNMFNEAMYGAKIVLVPTAKRKGSAAYNGSHIYLETEYGRFEAGSPLPPASNMIIDGGTIAAATFDDWGGYAEFDAVELKKNSKFSPSFSTFPEFFLDSKLTANLDTRPYSSEPSRTIAYYTPKFELAEKTKFQVGVSYTPDSSNTGADNASVNSRTSDIKKIEDTINVDGQNINIDHFELDRSVKDAFSAGISVEQNFSDGVDLKIALTGEYGKSAGKAKRFDRDEDNKPQTTPIEFKLSDLRTYNIGAVFNFGNFSCAGSFGSLGKSLTSPEFHRTGRNTDYYTGTFAYKQGPFAASVSYFRSNQFKNTVDAVSIGTHYVLAPGFKPYAEISVFNLKGRPEFRTDLDKGKTRGTVALIGAKMAL